MLRILILSRLPMSFSVLSDENREVVVKDSVTKMSILCITLLFYLNFSCWFFIKFGPSHDKGSSFNWPREKRNLVY